MCKLLSIQAGHTSLLQLGVELSWSNRYLNVCVEKVSLCDVEVSRIGVSFHVFGKLKSGSLAKKSVLKRGTKKSLSLRSCGSSLSRLCLF